MDKDLVRLTKGKKELKSDMILGTLILILQKKGL